MSTLDNQKEKAFDFCADSAKQLITLATGVIALTITFAKDFVVNVPAGDKTWAYCAWGTYMLSVLFGIVTLNALTSALEPSSTPQTGTALPSIWGAPSTYSLFQVSFFMLALFFTLVFGIRVAMHEGNQVPIKINKNQQYMDTVAHKQRLTTNKMQQIAPVKGSSVSVTR